MWMVRTLVNNLKNIGTLVKNDRFDRFQFSSVIRKCIFVDFDRIQWIATAWCMKRIIAQYSTK